MAQGGTTPDHSDRKRDMARIRDVHRRRCVLDTNLVDMAYADRRDLLAVEAASAAVAWTDSRTESATRLDAWRMYAVWTILFVSLLPWRTRVFYSGGTDPTVVAKAALTLVAMLVASVRNPHVGRIALGPRSVVLVAVYVVASGVGGWAAGAGAPSGVLAIRVAIVAATVVLAVRAVGIDEAAKTAMFSMCAVGFVIGAAGLPTFAASGRLSGGILPLNPNDLAMLFGPPTIWFLWKLFRGNAPVRYGAAVILLLGASWMTGSRTGMVALVAAALVVLIATPNIPRPALLSVVLAVPFAFYMLKYTSIISTFVGRNGTGNVSTLNSRTIAWSAVLNSNPDFSHLWFGGGFSTKVVAVAGQFWESQVVDSSWISAYIQAGLIGIIVLALWSITSLISAFRSGPDCRALWAGLVVFALIRSGLQSGLIDSAVLFVVMLLPSIALDLRPATMD